MLFDIVLLATSFLRFVAAHDGDHEDQTPIAGPHKGLWYNSLPGDGGTQVCRASGCHVYPADRHRPTPYSVGLPHSAVSRILHVYRMME